MSKDLISIITCERLRISRQKNIIDEVLKNVKSRDWKAHSQIWKQIPVGFRCFKIGKSNCQREWKRNRKRVEKSVSLAIDEIAKQQGLA